MTIAAPQAPQAPRPQGSLLDRAKALARRMPWWGWVLLVAAVYLGYKFITSGGVVGDEQDELTDGSTPGAGALPPLRELGELGGVGLPPLGELTPGLGDLDEDDGEDKTPGGDLDAFADQARRSRQQGADIRQYWKEYDAKMLSRQQKQALDLREANKERAAKTIARQRQQTQDIRAVSLRQQTATPPTPTGRRTDVNYGSGDGPDSATHRGQVYMRRGETLSEIAERYGVDTEDLYAANRDRLTVKFRERGWLGLGSSEAANLEGLLIAIPSR